MPIINDGKGNAKMFDGALNRKLGINTKSKYVNENAALLINKSKSKEDLQKILRIIDEQDAINRYKWYNIPCDLTSNEIERMLYFKGDICFFYNETEDKFYFMPYALDGTIDFYGRFNSIHPIPMAAGEDSQEIKAEDSPELKKRKKRYQSQLSVLSMLKLKVVKGVVQEEDLTEDLITKSAVILRDYTNQISQNNIPRSFLNAPLIQMMSDYFPFLSTNLLLGTGISSIRVQNSSDKDEVKKVAQAVYEAALNNNPYVALVSQIEFQELTGGARNRAEDYLMAFQSLDNFRLSTLGIANGGVFEKKAHILESENAINSSTVMSAYQDGLKIRQEFCNIVNSIWDLDLWCEPSESALGFDNDGDGEPIDRGESQPQVEGANVVNNSDEGGAE